MNRHGAVDPAHTMSDVTSQAFDASSKAWKANKVRYGQAAYRYKTNAFQKDPEEPPLPKQSAASKRQSQKELERRQALEEEAPLPVRKSPRLLQLHREQTYA